MRKTKLAISLYIVFVTALVSVSGLLLLHHNEAAALAAIPVSAVQSQPSTLVANQDGRLEMFIVGSDGLVHHTWQSSPNIWPANPLWATLGAPAGQNFDNMYNSMTVIKNQSNELELFAATASGSLWTISQVAPNGVWGIWVSLGGQGFQQAPLVFTDAEGRLEIFAVNSGSVLYSYQQTGSLAWSSWTSLSNVPFTAASLTGSVNADGRLEIAAISTTGTMWHIYQVSPTTLAWSPWSSLGTPVNADFIGRTAAMALQSDNRLAILAVDTNGFLEILQQGNGAGGWLSWTPLGSVNNGNASTTYRIATTFVSGTGEGVNAFVISSNDEIASVRESNGVWTTVTNNLGFTENGNYNGDLVHAAMNLNGTLDMFVYDNTAGAYMEIHQKDTTLPGGDWENAFLSLGYPS